MQGTVLIGAVDNTTNFSIIQHNIARLSSWRCILFGSVPGAASLSGLSSRCTLLDPPNDGHRWFWGGLLLTAAAAVPQNTTHVMVLLDDVDMSGVHVSRLIAMFTAYSAAVMSPRILGATYPAMYRNNTNLTVAKLDAIETYATVFTKSSFACFLGMINLSASAFPLYSIVGFGYDRCFSGLCNGSSYVFRGETAKHLGKRRLRGKHNHGKAQWSHLERVTRKTGRSCGRYYLLPS